MHSPSPSPSPPASLPESSSANGLPDHVTRLGSVGAWPLLPADCTPLLGALRSRDDTPILSPPSNATLAEPLLRPVLPAFKQAVEHSQRLHYSALISHGPEGGIVAQAEPAVEWIPTGIPADIASQNLNVDQDDTTTNAGVTASSGPGNQMGPNNFPANFPNLTDAGMAVGCPNAWDANNMYLNTPENMHPQIPNDSFPPIMASPAWASNTHPFGFGTPILPMAIQAPRAPTFCTLCPASFTRPSDNQRHWESVHLGIKHHCYWPGCSNNRGNGYCRAEKLRTHQRRVHGLA